MRGRGWAQAACVPGLLQRYSGCESGKKKKKGKGDIELGSGGEVDKEGKETGWKRSPRGWGAGWREGCRDGDGMVGTEDQGERRKGSQALEEKDWAGGGRAQGAKNLEEGMEAGKVVMTEGCGGDGVRIAKDNQGPKGSGLGVGRGGIQIQEIRIHSGLRSVKSPQYLRSGTQPAPGPVGHLRRHTSISCHRQRRSKRQARPTPFPDSLPGGSLGVGERQRGTILGNPSAVTA